MDREGVQGYLLRIGGAICNAFGSTTTRWGAIRVIFGVGVSISYVFGMSAACWEATRSTFGECLQRFRVLTGCWRGDPPPISTLLSTCWDGIRVVFGEYLQRVWGYLGVPLQGVGRVSAVYAGVFAVVEKVPSTCW